MPDKPRIGVFICHCGKNIAGTVNVPELAEAARNLPEVQYVGTNLYACSEPGQKEIQKAVAENQLNRVVVAACSPRMHQPTFQACVSAAGLNPSLLEIANIREGCSWVHLREPGCSSPSSRPVSRSSARRWWSAAASPESRRRWTWPIPASKSTWWNASPASAGPWPSSTRPIPPWTAPYEYSRQRWRMSVDIPTSNS